MDEPDADLADVLRRALLVKTDREPKNARGIEELLVAVSKEVDVSLQVAAVEFWDLLQWGLLRLTADGRVYKTSTRGDGGEGLEATREPSSCRDGRNHSEVRSADDPRSEARIDRDRIMQSWAFRRLEGVTQIVSPDHSGHLMHSRLTHSVKVGQVGRRIADRLAKTTSEELVRTGGGLDPDVVEAAGFAHDVGHPPFGHAGEKKLDRLARQMGLTEGFEGNAQTFRVLTGLEFRFLKPRGMNLTNATLSAVLKYPWPRAAVEDEKDLHWNKFNVYQIDLAPFREARDALAAAEGTQTLEASIMDIADDITYALHDLEDYYTAGLFRRNQVAAILGDYSLLRRDGHKPPTSDEYLLLDDLAEKLKTDHRNRFSQQEFDDAVDKVRSLVRFSMYRHFDGSRISFALIRTAFASRIDSYVREIDVSSVEGNGRAVARLSSKHWHEIEVLKWLNRKFVLDRAELALTQRGQTRLMEEATSRLQDWCTPRSSGNLDSRLPLTLREFVAEVGEDDQARARGIVDYVASLTDAQLGSLARALSGLGSPSSLYFV